MDPQSITDLQQKLRLAFFDDDRDEITRISADATVVKPVGIATGNGEGSRRRIRTRIAFQNPVAQVVVAILRGHGPFATPDRIQAPSVFARHCEIGLRHSEQPVRE